MEAAVGFEPDSEDGDVGGGDAADAGGLAEGFGADLGEFLDGFGAQAADGCVIDGVGDGSVFLAFGTGDFGFLALDVAGVFDVGFD